MVSQQALRGQVSAQQGSQIALRRATLRSQAQRKQVYTPTKVPLTPAQITQQEEYKIAQKEYQVKETQRLGQIASLQTQLEASEAKRASISARKNAIPHWDKEYRNDLKMDMAEESGRQSAIRKAIKALGTGYIAPKDISRFVSDTARASYKQKKYQYKQIELKAQPQVKAPPAGVVSSGVYEELQAGVKRGDPVAIQAMKKLAPGTSIVTFKQKQIEQPVISPKEVKININPDTGLPWGASIISAAPTGLKRLKSYYEKDTPIAGTLKLIGGETRRIVSEAQRKQRQKFKEKYGTSTIDKYGAKYDPLTTELGGMVAETGVFFTPASPYVITGLGAERLVLEKGREKMAGETEALKEKGWSPTLAKITPWAASVGLVALGTAGTWLPKVKGYMATKRRTKIPVEELVPPKVISGKKTFPTADPKTHLTLFKKEGVGYHAYPEEWTSLTTTAGSSELPGTYVSSKISPHFLKITPSGSSAGKTGWFDKFVEYSWGSVWGGGKPGVMEIKPEGGFRHGKWVKVKPYKIDGQTFKYKWVDDIVSGVIDVPAMKNEIEGIIRPNTELIKTGGGKYFKWKGVRVPIDEYSILGKEITTTTTALTGGTVESISGSYSSVYNPSTSYLGMGLGTVALTSDAGGYSATTYPSSITGDISISKISSMKVIPKPKLTSLISKPKKSKSYIYPKLTSLSIISSRAPSKPSKPITSLRPRPSYKPSTSYLRSYGGGLYPSKIPSSYKPTPSYISKPSYIPKPSYTPRPSYVPRPSYKPGPSYVPKPRYVPGGYYKPGKRIRKKIRREKRPSSYWIPEVKKGKEWMSLGKYQTPTMALARAKGVTLSSLRASLRVRKAGTEQFLTLKPTTKFRSKKRAGVKDPFTLVQRKRKTSGLIGGRLSSPGERAEIKRLAAQRKKRLKTKKKSK